MLAGERSDKGKEHKDGVGEPRKGKRTGQTEIEMAYNKEEVLDRAKRFFQWDSRIGKLVQ